MPAARIDGAAAVVPGAGLLIFGGVAGDFNFAAPRPWLVSPPVAATSADGWALGAPEAHDVSVAPPPWPPAASDDGEAAPCARACLSMCADGLHVYCFGGFDGERDLADLWCLSLVPAAFRGEAAAPLTQTHAHPLMASCVHTHGELQAEMFKIRQARQAAVLHTTPGAAGHNFQPIHVRVFQAGL